MHANLGGTDISKPLSYVFSTPLSVNCKMRRVYVLTDGCVSDPSEVIFLFESNSTTEMCNSIGIGYGVDTNLVKQIGNK